MNYPFSRNRMWSFEICKVALRAMLFVLALVSLPAEAQKTTRRVSEKLLSGIGVSEMLNSSYTISNNLRRIAFKMQIEKKQIVVIDTLKGKPYDRVGNPIFSANASRFAYAAKKDTNWLIIVDNRQEVILDSGSSVTTIIFSPDSKTYLYVVKRGLKFFVVSNGNKGKLYDAIDENSITYSSDSKRIAYSAGLDKKHMNVIDGVEGYPFDQVGYPILSVDGKRSAYWGMIGNEYFAVIDNQKSTAYASVGAVIFSQDGKHCAYNAVLGEKHLVVLDGVQSEKYELVHSLLFSPDGLRLAYGVTLPQADKEGNKDYVVVDGKSAGPYESVTQGSLIFSPDGRDLAYKAEWHDAFFMASNRNRKMIYSDILQGTTTFSADGSRLAFAAENNSRRLVNDDDNEIGPYDEVYSVSYSPDSKRLAYSVRLDNKDYVVVDGRDGRTYDSLLGQGEIIFDSPDTFHYIAARGNSVFLVEERFE